MPLRTIIRQLVPVEVDKQGLVASLRGLAQQISESHDHVCEFECQRPVTVADAALATHLYRIVQEAVAKAINTPLPEGAQLGATTTGRGVACSSTSTVSHSVSVAPDWEKVFCPTRITS